MANKDVYIAVIKVVINKSKFEVLRWTFNFQGSIWNLHSLKNLSLEFGLERTLAFHMVLADSMWNSTRTICGESVSGWRLHYTVSSVVGRWQLRSANSGTLVVPGTRTTIGRRNFAVSGPATWNRLPVEVGTAECGPRNFLMTHPPKSSNLICLAASTPEDLSIQMDILIDWLIVTGLSTTFSQPRLLTLQRTRSTGVKEYFHYGCAALRVASDSER